MLPATLRIWSLVFLAALIVAPAQANTRGLPDFTDLIEQHSPAVVKISTVERASSRRRGQPPLSQHHDIPDIFRHLFEPPALPEREVRSMGSGFIISKDGYVLTNHHVVDGADEIVVRLIDRREFDAEVVGSDSRSDLALLKITAEDLPVLTFAEPDSVRVGEWVLAIGSPFGLDYSASVGIVSAIGRSIPSRQQDRSTYVPFIQTDVAINPGNSGGPLFNLRGEVVGINSQIYTRTGGSIGLSFAIPSGVAQDVVAQLQASGRVERGWLGVVIQEVDRDLADSFGLDKPSGALIAQMEPNGPAERSGLKVGDVIVRFGANEVPSSRELPHLVGRTPPDTEVPVTVMRQGREQLVAVTLGALATEDAPRTPSPTQPDNGADRLGLVVQELDERLSQRVQVDSGVVIQEVQADSPAARAGLRPGDVIQQLGFHQIESLEDYQRVLEELPEDRAVPVLLSRSGSPTFRSLTISPE